jgi:hypothetical protein
MRRSIVLRAILASAGVVLAGAVFLGLVDLLGVYWSFNPFKVGTGKDVFFFLILIVVLVRYGLAVRRQWSNSIPSVAAREVDADRLESASELAAAPPARDPPSCDEGSVSPTLPPRGP